MRLPEYYYPWLLFGACAMIFLPHLGVLPVNIMEARNFISAREMIQDQHWLLTTLNGEPRYEKPPLPTWITAISGAVFGLQHIAALRLPAVLMAFLLAFTCFRFTKKITDNTEYSFVSILIMITSFYILWSGRNGQWDIFTHAFMILAIYHFYLMFTSSTRHHLHGFLSGLFIGFSFLSKGPVSLYALFLPFLISFGAVYRFGGLKNPSRKIPPHSIFILIFTSIIIGSWWYLYIYLFDTEASQAITNEEISNWKNYNIRPFYYYWNFFIQSGIWSAAALVSLIYPYLKNRVSDRRAYTFTFIWTISAVVLLSLIPEKKPRYLLPVLIPLAMNMGFYIEYLFKHLNDRSHFWEKFPVILQFGIIAVVGLATPILGYFILKDNLDGNWIWFLLLSSSLLALAIFILKNLWKWQIRKVFYLTISFICCVVLFALPLSSSLTVNPLYKSMHHLKQWEQETGLPVFEFREISPELIWAYGKPMKVLYNQNTVEIPDLDIFAVVAYEDLEEDVRKTFEKDFHIEKKDYYDMNPRGKNQGGHKGRLYRDLYIMNRDQSGE